MLNTVCHDAELQMPMLNAEFIFNEGLCYKKGCSSYRPYFADLYSWHRQSLLAAIRCTGRSYTWMQYWVGQNYGRWLLGYVLKLSMHFCVMIPWSILKLKLSYYTRVSWSWETGEEIWVNNLPKVAATQWNSGSTRESNRGPRARIPSALTTRPLSHTACVFVCRRTVRSSCCCCSTHCTTS